MFLTDMVTTAPTAEAAEAGPPTAAPPPLPPSHATTAAPPSTPQATADETAPPTATPPPHSSNFDCRNCGVLPRSSFHCGSKSICAKAAFN